MRRNDLEITNLNKIIKILDKSPTLRLGLHDNPYPYVVPLSYGYSIKNNTIEFYIHGASIGKKHNLIKKNNFVCVEADYIEAYELTKLSATTKYSSIIAYGKIFTITDENERLNAISSISTHCGLENLKINKNLFKKVKMYKIIVDEISAKSNLYKK